MFLGRSNNGLLCCSQTSPDLQWRVIQVASSHLGSHHLNPQNDAPSISFSTMKPGKNPLELESFPCAFFSISSISGDFSSKAQNLTFGRCSKDDIVKSDE
ncbi:hypothetical protein TNCV_977011 [Trichonephila clavipes]|nr:hypothetical protein TNCV_977011 [Trichonephila clavipes]